MWCGKKTVSPKRDQGRMRPNGAFLSKKVKFASKPKTVAER
ncbi:hypothetical protein PSAB6_240063 [Paraburkholderia sabiae]|nr:hypothetical protein PSAB6_240063 [Paraburkholderia sabiae]